MCTPTLLLTAASTVMGAMQARAQGKYQEGVAKYNARVAENQAQETRNVGTEKENLQRLKTARLLATQRAQLGASGVLLGSGSAAQLQEDTLTLGEADALRIRQTTESQVGALETGAELTRSQGAMAASAGRSKAFSTLLGGAASMAGTGVADKWFTPNSSANSMIQSQTGFRGGASGVLSGAEFAQF